MNARTTDNPILSWFASLLPSKKNEPVFSDCHIVTDREGFKIVKEVALLEAVAWPSVSIIVAYKRDLITTDLICFEIVLDDGSMIEINEEMDGFDLFLNGLESTFESYNRTWPDSVVLPPFAPNRTLVYSGIAPANR